MEWLKNTMDMIIAWATSIGLKLLIALILMYVSFKIINWFAKKIVKNGEKKGLDKTIVKTLSYLVKIGGKVIVTVCLVGYVGIDTSAITALIASRCLHRIGSKWSSVQHCGRSFDPCYKTL